MESAFILWITPIVAGFALFLLKRSVEQLDKDITELKAQHNSLQNDIQNIKSEYLHKNDFREFKVELREMFEELKSDIKGLRNKNA